MLSKEAHWLCGSGGPTDPAVVPGAGLGVWGLGIGAYVRFVMGFSVLFKVDRIFFRRPSGKGRRDQGLGAKDWRPYTLKP